MHAKYTVSISYGTKVIANVKVDNKQTNRQTGQKQYDLDHSIQGHENILESKWSIRVLLIMTRTLKTILLEKALLVPKS